MSTTKSNVEKIREYFRLQYELEEGTVKDNIYALFTEDAVYHLGGGNTVTPEAVAQTAHLIRQTPKSERIAQVSDFKEEGDLVSFRMYVRFRNPETGEFGGLESNHVWRFNAEGKVVEAKPQQVDDIVDAFRASGVEL